MTLTHLVYIQLFYFFQLIIGVNMLVYESVCPTLFPFQLESNYIKHMWFIILYMFLHIS